MDTAAIILAGGLATRMGGEKALRPLNGRTLLEHACEIVRPLAGEIVVALGNRDMLLPAGVRGIQDPPQFPQQGPLSGILAGLHALTCEHALLLPCDTPHVPPALCALLLARLVGVDVVFCAPRGQPEPLVAALCVKQVRAAVERELGAGRRKVVPLWRSLPHVELSDADLAAFEPLERAFANINTLADLQGP